MCGRVETCKDEIEFIIKRKDTYGKITDMLKGGELPLHVTHNDTKLNNVLIDADSGKPRAVIDLDTVMPGEFIIRLRRVYARRQFLYRRHSVCG